MIRRINPVQLKTVSNEWDIIGPLRQIAIEQGKDISLERTTGPCIMANTQAIKHHHILDVGCGTGYLTNELSNIANECWGIDISSKSIKTATHKYQKDNLHFLCSAIKDFSSDLLFDVCIANMVFMDDPEWIDSLQNIVNLLSHDGKLLFTITHPCFWPRYWGYQNEEWFNYQEELYIQGQFSITLQKDFGITTLIHRPLESYISAIINSGLSIEKLCELYSSYDLNTRKEINYPRFIFIMASKS